MFEYTLLICTRNNVLEIVISTDQLKTQDNELVFTSMVTGKKIKIPLGTN